MNLQLVKANTVRPGDILYWDGITYEVEAAYIGSDGSSVLDIRAVEDDRLGVTLDFDAYAEVRRLEGKHNA